MAKITMRYFGLELQAEGEEAFCLRQTEAFLNHVREDAERDDQDESRPVFDTTTDLSDAPEDVKREILRNAAAMQDEEYPAEVEPL